MEEYSPANVLSSNAFLYRNAILGTPQTPDEMGKESQMSKKSKQITLWISPEELIKLQKFVDTAGLTRSAYIRRAILKQAVNVKPAACHMQIKPLLCSLSEEIVGIAPAIGEAEALRLRGMVYEAYRQCGNMDSAHGL